jgi:hypothetical protein
MASQISPQRPNQAVTQRSYDMRRQDIEVITCWKYSQLDLDDFIYTFCKLDVIVADSIDIVRN